MGRPAIEAFAYAYLDFAEAHPAVYEVMFRQPIDARFAEDDNEPELREAFNVLAEVTGGPAAAEVFWGAVHGISLLERAQRMKPEHRTQRVRELGARFATGDGPATGMDPAPR